MNTFFVSPLIPLKFYILIQKEYKNINLTSTEKIFLKNLNKLFDYSSILSEDDKNTIANIINKIINSKSEYEKLTDKLTFVNQNTFSEITNYNYVYYDLLKLRNYDHVVNPFKIDYINMCVGLSDTGPLVDLDTSNFSNLDDSGKITYIQNLIDSKNKNIKTITHKIMAKSLVDSKINTITKILSNKNILYNYLKNENFIPQSETFRITDEDNVIENIIKIFKNYYSDNYDVSSNESNVSTDSYFVIKPAEGTLSDGVGILKLKELDLNFVKKWTTDKENNKYTVTGQYNTWILSRFIKSFLWKLEGQNLTSLKFPKLTNSIPSFKFNFNDKIGRINKFRFWALYTIIDNEFTSYLYEDGYCEIALEELSTFSKTQLDPANIETFYQNILNVEEDVDTFAEITKNLLSNKITQNSLDIYQQKIQASTTGTYLDFARVVNANNFPLGKDKWNNVLIPNMYHIVNTIGDKTKKYMNCMNDFLNKNSMSTCCYSLYALDIIVDDNAKPWLLETNSRPFVGFDNYWTKLYDNNNTHCINVHKFLNTVLKLTTDLVNGNRNGNGNEDDLTKFKITMIDKLKDFSNTNIYFPLSLGITDTATSKVYNEIYDILEKEGSYRQFPYPMVSTSLNGPGFRGMSPLSKFLISKINELGKEKVLLLLQQLFPYDAKMKILNRIPTLGFYLGDKAVMTTLLKQNVPNWDTIIPYSFTVNLSELTDEDIKSKIKESTLNNSTIIAKPAYGQQGKGIIISKNIDELVSKMRNNPDNDKDYVISKYLDNPYLIKLNKTGVSGVKYDDKYGRKSHLRAYVLVVKENDTLKIYMYRDSLIFCAAKEYNSCDDNNKDFCNLTNLYFGSKYYKEVLNKNPGDAYKDLSGLAKDLIPQIHYTKFMERVKYIIKTVILSVKDNLVCLNTNLLNNDISNHGNCYQYIAFDLHLENYTSQNNNSSQTKNNISIPQPWLLEVNATPGLKSPTYQWEINKSGGLNNFLESILNITLNTKLSSGNKQLFQYLPYKRIITKLDKEIPFQPKYFESIQNCMQYYYKDLKQILREYNIPDRSILNTKKLMCKTLMKYSK